jgi:hypothetical protein
VPVLRIKSQVPQYPIIWCINETREGKRNQFCYRFLKPRGLTTFFKMDERVKIRTATGILVTLNLKKPIPIEAWTKYHEAIGK